MNRVEVVDYILKECGELDLRLIDKDRVIKEVEQELRRTGDLKVS